MKAGKGPSKNREGWLVQARLPSPFQDGAVKEQSVECNGRDNVNTHASQEGFHFLHAVFKSRNISVIKDGVSVRRKIQWDC